MQLLEIKIPEIAKNVERNKKRFIGQSIARE
jgi:hypothetical protein